MANSMFSSIAIPFIFLYIVALTYHMHPCASTCAFAPSLMLDCLHFTSSLGNTCATHQTLHRRTSYTLSTMFTAYFYTLKTHSILCVVAWVCFALVLLFSHGGALALSLFWCYSITRKRSLSVPY